MGNCTAAPKCEKCRLPMPMDTRFAHCQHCRDVEAMQRERQRPIPERECTHRFPGAPRERFTLDFYER